MLQKGERVLGDSSDLMDSREAPSYANYLALVSCYLLVYVGAASARVYKRERVCECAYVCRRATDKPSRIPRCQSTIPVCLPRRIFRFFRFCTQTTCGEEEDI